MAKVVIKVSKKPLPVKETKKEFFDRVREIQKQPLKPKKKVA